MDFNTYNKVLRDLSLIYERTNNLNTNMQNARVGIDNNTNRLDQLITAIQAQKFDLTPKKKPKGLLEWKLDTNVTDAVVYKLFISKPDNVLCGRMGHFIFKYGEIGNSESYEEGINLTETLNGIFEKAFIWDGGVVYVTRQSSPEKYWIYKATSITDENPQLVHHGTGGYPMPMSIQWHYDGYQSVMLVGEYGSGINPDYRRRLWLSTDFGTTWTAIKECEHANTTQQSHWHTATFDPAMGRIWASEGDAEHRQVHYSDDFGATWTGIGKGQEYYQPTLILPFANRVIFGRDEQQQFPGLDYYDKPQTAEDYAPVSFGDALSFRLEGSANMYYPEFFANKGEEGYIMFEARSGDAVMGYIYATGDGGQSWHCVATSKNDVQQIQMLAGITHDGYIACRVRTHATLPQYRLLVAKALEWE